MSESEWLSSTDPVRMLAWLLTAAEGQFGETGVAIRKRHPITTDRKLRLFAVACCRAVWDQLTDERSRRAVEVAERYADGEATESERQAAWDYLELEAPHSPAWIWASIAVQIPVDLSRGRPAALAIVPPTTQATLLRCIFGNPWRPVLPGMQDQFYAVEPAWLRWNDGTAPKIAQSICDGHRFDEMPILGDALEDAGCPDVPCPTGCKKVGSEWLVNGERCPSCHGTTGTATHPMVAHCRGSEPHARGCWVLDFLLGKS